MATATLSDGSIRADELYSLTELRRRLDLGQGALRTARRRGLRVRRIGRKSYVLGRDVVRGRGSARSTLAIWNLSASALSGVAGKSASMRARTVSRS